jgi:hypothetical protein
MVELISAKVLQPTSFQLTYLFAVLGRSKSTPIITCPITVVQGSIITSLQSHPGSILQFFGGTQRGSPWLCF